MVTYNALTHPKVAAGGIALLLRKATNVTFGTQINNLFVLFNLTNGRAQPLQVAARRAGGRR